MCTRLMRPRSVAALAAALLGAVGATLAVRSRRRNRPRAEVRFSDGAVIVLDRGQPMEPLVAAARRLVEGAS